MWKMDSLSKFLRVAACVLLLGSTASASMVYRTTNADKWGTGKGTPLTMEELDEDLWTLYNLLGSASEYSTATAGQTVITTTWQYPYGKNLLAVYINGLRQAPDTYTETDATTITLDNALNAGDIIHVVYSDRTGNERQQYARAWGQFTVAGGAIDTSSSFGVASITYISTGVYEVTLQEAMADTSYAPLVSAENGALYSMMLASPGVPSSTTVFRIYTGTDATTLAEARTVTFSVYGL